MRIALKKYVLLLAALGCAREKSSVVDTVGAQASASPALTNDTSRSLTPDARPGARRAGGLTPDARPGARRAGGLTPNARRTVLFVGTSLTAGMGLDPDVAYPQLIQRKIDSAGLRYEVVNAGISGETSASLLRRLDWLMREPFDVIVIETGANDGLRGIPVTTMKQNIQQILEHVRAARPTARIALVQMEAMPNLGKPYTEGFREVFPELARRNKVTLLPFLLDGVAGIRSLNQGDGIHPNEEGERIVAENVWKALKPLLN